MELIFFIAAWLVLCLWQNGVDDEPVFHLLLNCLLLHSTEGFCFLLCLAIFPSVSRLSGQETERDTAIETDHI